MLCERLKMFITAVDNDMIKINVSNLLDPTRFFSENNMPYSAAFLISDALKIGLKFLQKHETIEAKEFLINWNYSRTNTELNALTEELEEIIMKDEELPPL